MSRAAQNLLYGRRHSPARQAITFEKASQALAAGNPYPVIDYLQKRQGPAPEKINQLIADLAKLGIDRWPEVDKRHFLDEHFIPSEEVGLRHRLNGDPLAGAELDLRQLIRPLTGLSANEFQTELLRALTSNGEDNGPALKLISEMDVTKQMRFLWQMTPIWQEDKQELYGSFYALLINDLTWRLAGLVEQQAREVASDLHLISIASPCVFICDDSKLHLVKDGEILCADERVETRGPAIRGQWRGEADKRCPNCFHLNAPKERQNNLQPWLTPGSDDPLAYTLLGYSRYEDLQEMVYSNLEMAASRYHKHLSEGHREDQTSARILAEMADEIYSLREMMFSDHSEIIAKTFIDKWRDGDPIFRANFPNKAILGEDNYAELHNFLMYSKQTPSQKEVENWLGGLFIARGNSSQKITDGFYEHLGLWAIANYDK